MVAKLTRLTHKIATMQLHLVAESCTICSSRSQAVSPETSGYTLVDYEDNIKMDIKEVRCDGVDWVHLGAVLSFFVTDRVPLHFSLI
jgi:hypothetical protein